MLILVIMSFLSIIGVILFFIFSNKGNTSNIQPLTEVEETKCEGEQLIIQCNSGKNINITEGFYGRKDKTTCPHAADSNINCSAVDAKEKLQRECNDKNSCNITLDNTLFGDPCEGTFKYATIKYTCT